MGVGSAANNITFIGNELGNLVTLYSEALTFDGSLVTNGLLQDNYIPMTRMGMALPPTTEQTTSHSGTTSWNIFPSSEMVRFGTTCLETPYISMVATPDYHRAELRE